MGFVKTGQIISVKRSANKFGPPGAIVTNADFRHGGYCSTKKSPGLQNKNGKAVKPGEIG